MSGGSDQPEGCPTSTLTDAERYQQAIEQVAELTRTLRRLPDWPIAKVIEACRELVQQSENAEQALHAHLASSSELPSSIAPIEEVKRIMRAHLVSRRMGTGGTVKVRHWDRALWGRAGIDQVVMERCGFVCELYDDDMRRYPAEQFLNYPSDRGKWDSFTLTDASDNDMGTVPFDDLISIEQSDEAPYFKVVFGLI